MILSQIFDGKYDALGKALDLSWRRHKAISANIANADTPQYRATDLHFGNELARAFEVNQQQVMKTDKGHLDLEEAGSARLIPDYSGATKADGNNVDIDIQMGRLAQNSGKYSQAAKLMRRQFERLSTVLRTVA